MQIRSYSHNCKQFHELQARSLVAYVGYSQKSGYYVERLLGREEYTALTGLIHFCMGLFSEASEKSDA